MMTLWISIFRNIFWIICTVVAIFADTYWYWFWYFHEVNCWIYGIVCLIYFILWNRLYIYNDTQSIKHDAHPTYRVNNPEDIGFWKKQILIRILLWISLLVGIYHIYGWIFWLYVVNMMLMWMVYTVQA